jgi:hypothetical protein
MARTANGVPITEGLAVWTSDLERATVVTLDGSFEEGGETWFYVSTAVSSRSLASESRVTTRHPFTGEKA